MRARAVAAIALSGALALGLSGCSMFMHVETARPYDPSDGIGASIDGLELRNLLVISEDGEIGNLIGGAVNTGDADIDFTVQWKADGTRHSVELTAKANTTTMFGLDDQVLLDPLGEKPGGLLSTVVHVPGGQQELRIPILDTTLSEYQGLAPTPVPTPTPTPSATVTAEPEGETADG